MDNESVKDYYRGIQASDAEMARFRAHLAQRLPVSKDHPVLLRIVVPAAAVAAALVFLVLRDPGLRFSQLELSELEIVAANASPEVVAKAHKLAAQGDGLDRWNACVILCLTEPMDQIAGCIAGGLEDDPRPEIRAFYLEQLLERADEYQYNIEMVEDLWDREIDSTCRSLYKDLFRIAV